MQPSYRRLLWILALSGAILDQVSKYTIFAALNHPTDNRLALVPQTLDLIAQYKQNEAGERVPYVNHGALFGLGQAGEKTANLVFAGISLLAALAIIGWSLHPATARDRWLCCSLGLILAGTLGNLYDRLVFGGVRDFMHFYIKSDGKVVFDWPVFNFADVCLVCGAGLLLLQAFWVQPVADPQTPAPASETAPATAGKG
jgi:lipoprotein signal peptidase